MESHHGSQCKLCCQGKLVFVSIGKTSYFCQFQISLGKMKVIVIKIVIPFFFFLQRVFISFKEKKLDISSTHSASSHWTVTLFQAFSQGPDTWRWVSVGREKNKLCESTRTTKCVLSIMKEKERWGEILTRSGGGEVLPEKVLRHLEFEW